MNENIKALLPATCPHCDQDFMIAYTIAPPTLTGLITNKMITDAKSDLTKRVMKMGLEQQTKEQVLAWIGDKETVFTPADVDEIIKNLEKDNVNTQKITTE